MPSTPSTQIAASGQPAPAPAGVRAPVRDRGQRSERALLEAGRELLKQRHFDTLRLEDICRTAGLTTGAFYRRFAGKDAFLASLQARAIDDMRASLASLRLTLGNDALAPAEITLTFATPMLDWARENRGVLRALMQRATQERGQWSHFREIAPQVVSTLSPPLHAALGIRRTATSERRLAIAYQIAAGAVVNMIINNPGPMHLGNRRLAQTLADSMLSFFTYRAKGAR